MLHPTADRFAGDWGGVHGSLLCVLFETPKHPILLVMVPAFGLGGYRLRSFWHAVCGGVARQAHVARATATAVQYEAGRVDVAC